MSRTAYARKLSQWEMRAAVIDPAYRQQLFDDYRAVHPHTVTPGTVVEYLRMGRAHSGVIVRAGAHAHRVLDVDGKEHLAPKEQIFDLSDLFVGLTGNRHEVLAILRDIDQEREVRKAALELHQLWDLVAAEPRVWSFTELAALFFADDAGDHGRAALARALTESGYFRREGMSFVPADRETVIAWLTRKQFTRSEDAQLREAARWLRRLADGDAATPPPGAGHALRLLADRVVFGPEHPDAARAAELAQLAHFHTREATVDALVAAGYWQRDENLDLLRYATPTSFSVEALAEAAAARWQVCLRDVPRLTGRRVYASAQSEFAISIRDDRHGFTVGVHIATPALLLRRDGIVQREALERAVALQLPDRAIPLLPPAITERTALSSDAFRPCLTLLIRFTPDGTLQRARFLLQRVKVTLPLAVDAETLDDDAGLRTLHRLAQALCRRRLDAGAVIMAAPEVTVRVDGDRIALETHHPHAPGRLIEREMAILANRLTGELCATRQISAIYRAEAPPAQHLADPDRFDPVAVHRQKRLLHRATLQTDPAPHAGVGAEEYVPITAPARRYSDLLMHQQLLGFLEQDQATYTHDELAQALQQTATARLARREIETGAHRYWLLRYLEGRVGDTLDAAVLERYAGGYLLELTETRLTAYCAVDTPSLQPGAHVRVRVTQVSARMDAVRMRMVM